jgi:hypothetical protein
VIGSEHSERKRIKKMASLVKRFLRLKEKITYAEKLETVEEIWSGGLLGQRENYFLEPPLSATGINSCYAS